ncbi:hypothetical protein BURPS1106B_1402 [Burkholderia pseudomallei 1106b]|uniref:Uncharacterized protein n=1 Tax=Burkholderia pseudomallei (strain 1106a) TaxID=357348 RepID=A3P2S1_BURP0|nr:hypothetical protein BURPS1106A_A0596 [Burkholderia pseudomallei 1106a]AFR18574.1 hypothetical protein BPC006_II0642 [Burkholderia pseudomallei BPC006]EES23728.1 hypothetical protein BURPS1106B_1402 [Burkholderia pseudomallei 1106b]
MGFARSRAGAAIAAEADVAAPSHRTTSRRLARASGRAASLSFKTRDKRSIRERMQMR